MSLLKICRNRALNKLALSLLLICPSMPLIAQTIDADLAETFARKNDCFKCHAISKRKKAPSYVEIAAKYKDKADAHHVLYLHLTGNPLVKLDDNDEPHSAPKTKDKADLDNLISWILTR